MMSEGAVSPGGRTGALEQPIPLFFGDPRRSLFGWLHPAEAPSHRGVVVCNPIGYESILCHRAVRHLSEQLAAAGIPTLRFDYDGTGDSVGSDHDPGRVRAWIDSVHTAIAELKQRAALGEVLLVGTRMGATLAVLAACEEPIGDLVLWAPCVSGRQYTREMQVLAMTSSVGETTAHATSGELDAAGFTLSAECLDDLRRIDLLDCGKPMARRALVVGRDDLPDDTRVSDRLRGLGLDVEYRRGGGYSEMMAEPHFNVVPHDTIGAIVEWLGHDVARSDDGLGTASPAPQATTFEVAVPSFARSPNATVSVTESTTRFGPDKRLFGILARPTEQVSGGRPAMLLLNTGSVHHIGVNRTYVTLARRLATLGVPSLRFDISGLGDSVASNVAFENHPYPPNLQTDIDSALALLGGDLGCERIILLGLCSGAYAAFHAALRSDRIVESIMVNPLTFRWEEGMSLETPPHQHYANVSQYKQSALNLLSWRRMLTGQVDVGRVISVSLKQLRRVSSGYLRSARSAFTKTSLDGDLNNDLRRLSEQGTYLTFVFAKGDPGFDLLTTEAVWMVRQLRRKNAMTIEIIDNADHTFSPRPARRQLIDTILERVLVQISRDEADKKLSQEGNRADPLLEGA